MTENMKQAMEQFNDAMDNLKLVVGKSVEQVSKADEINKEFEVGTFVNSLECGLFLGQIVNVGNLKSSDEVEVKVLSHATLDLVGEVGTYQINELYEFTLPAGMIVLNKANRKYRIIKCKREFGGGYWLTNGAWDESSNLEVVTPIEKPSQNGDKILITDETANQFGELHTIKSIKRYPDGKIIKISTQSNHQYEPEQFEIVERPTELPQEELPTWRKELFENHGRKWNEFRENDVVKHPYENHYTHIDRAEAQTNFAEINFPVLGNVQKSEVIPVCFVNDRLDL